VIDTEDKNGYFADFMRESALDLVTLSDGKLAQRTKNQQAGTILRIAFWAQTYTNTKAPPFTVAQLVRLVLGKMTWAQYETVRADINAVRKYGEELIAKSKSPPGWSNPADSPEVADALAVAQRWGVKNDKSKGEFAPDALQTFFAATSEMRDSESGLSMTCENT
jgi:hypothetical protein